MQRERILSVEEFRKQGFSLLRASVGERLGLVAVALVLLWAAVFWALR